MTYCERCNRLFGSESAFNQHRVDSLHHNFCGDCSKEFSTTTELEKHWARSPHHPYCQFCNIHFENPSDLKVHCIEELHSYCRPCNRVFVNEDVLQRHFSQSGRHHYCLPCERHLRSEDHLRNHLNSSVHRPKDVDCRFKECEMKFVSRSALALHLEYGRCKSGIDRHILDKNVHDYDRDNVITDYSPLPTGGNTKHTATSRSWNGSSYECHLCDGIFASLQSLNQHLGSPVHQDKIYSCPASGCRIRFTTFSALCQHVESERCGAFRFKSVQRIMDKILGPIPPRPAI